MTKRRSGKAVAVTVVMILVLLPSAMARQTAPAPPAGQETPAGNAGTGRTLYLKIGCYQCHGNEGQGGAAGPRLGPAPMQAFRAFATYLRAPRGEMPPYTAKVLTDQGLADIYAYLAALPRPPSIDNIPLLKPAP